VTKATAVPETARQEIEITLGGKTFLCRPDFETLANIELQMGEPCRGMGMKALAAMMPAGQRGGFSEISMTELAAALYWMLKGKKGSPASVQAVGEILMDEGCAPFLMPVGQFLTRAHRGNAEHMKEAAQENAETDPPQETAKPAD